MWVHKIFYILLFVLVAFCKKFKMLELKAFSSVKFFALMKKIELKTRTLTLTSQVLCVVKLVLSLPFYISLHQILSRNSEKNFGENFEKHYNSLLFLTLKVKLEESLCIFNMVRAYFCY